MESQEGLGISKQSTFASFLWERLVKKREKSFWWKDFLEFIQILLEETGDKELLFYIEHFILLTDIFDDLMDNDNPWSPINLKEYEEELASVINRILYFIGHKVSKEGYKQFIDLIAYSLIYQQQENEYVLEETSSEQDYFYLVNKSTCLLKSIVYLISQHPPSIVLEGVEKLAISSQIYNDMDDLQKEISFDLLYKKPTLPILKGVELITKENCDFNYDFVSSNLDAGESSYSCMKKIISNSNIHFYCEILALSYRKQAKNDFLSGFPQKFELISSFMEGDCNWKKN